MMTDHPHLETLSAYSDRELAGDEQAHVERHLAGCPACRAELSRVRALVAAAAALPRGVEPPEAVWQAIRARASGHHTSRARRAPAAWGYLLAAALVFAVAGATLLRPGRSAKMRDTGGRPEVTAAALTMVDRSYVGSIEELRSSLDQQRHALAPSTVRILERSLAVIDTAIAEARAALAADPGNQALADILAAQYEHKVGLLQRATKLSPST